MVDRDTMYMSRSPSPWVHVALRPPTASLCPGGGAKCRFPTALGTETQTGLVRTGSDRIGPAQRPKAGLDGACVNVLPVRALMDAGIWLVPLNVDTTIL